MEDGRVGDDGGMVVVAVVVVVCLVCYLSSNSSVEGVAEKTILRCLELCM
jgi:hypothetical protein